MNKKIRKEFRIVFLAMALTLGICGIIYAFPEDRVLFAGRYPGSPLTLLSTVSGVPGNQCTICHGSSGPPLNSYGSAYLNAGGPGNVAALQAIEPNDSDGDTFSNITEINAGSFPGNAASVPPPPVDAEAPVVTAFVIPGTSSSLTVPITTFTATDNVAVTGLLVTESPNTPAASGPPWTPTAPANFIFTTPGQKTLFAWAKDAANNVSTSQSQTVTITLPPPATFADVPPTHIAFNHVEAIFAAGITGGCQTGLFCPDLVVDRAQMASFIVRAVDGANATVCSGTVFTDVTAANAHCANIERLRAINPPITLGCTATEYCPGNSVPREQMAAFIIRAVFPGDPPGVCAAQPFPDVLVSSPFCRHIQELVTRAITLGCVADDPLTPANEARYCPANLVTRAQMAIFLARAFLGVP